MTDKPTSTVEEARKEVLASIWHETARRVLGLLRDTPEVKLKGSTLQGCINFLKYNGVTADALGTPDSEAEQALAAMLEALKDLDADKEITAADDAHDYTPDLEGVTLS